MMNSDSDDFEHVSECSDLGDTPEDNETAYSIENIRNWLRPTDYSASSSEYIRHLGSQTPGTGLWIRQTVQFDQWQTSQCASLLIKGNPGTGKSVVAASMVEHLQKSQSAPVLFFFFRQIVEANRYSEALIRDWIAQLVEFSPKLQFVLRGHIKALRDVESLSKDQLWGHLLTGLKQMPKVYCIADALDEMSQDEDFLRRLNSLNSLSPDSVKLLMTSRPQQNLQSLLRDSKVLQVSLEQELIERDIKAFVIHRTESRFYQKIDHDIRENIRNTILMRSEGLFLYARLILDQIDTSLDSSQENVDRLGHMLQQLPIGLDDMYTRMLEDQSFRTGISRDVQHFLLQCATHSARPMRLLEMATALETYCKGTISSEHAKTITRTACYPLLEILEDETIQVIHHSFTEYLLGINHRTSVSGGPSPNIVHSLDAEKTLFQVCLDYLGTRGTIHENNSNEVKPDFMVSSLGVKDHQDFSKGLREREALQRYPFSRYAITNWCYHGRRFDVDNSDLFAVLDKFAHSSQVGFQLWTGTILLDKENELGEFDRTSLGKSWTPLHVAAFAGLTEYARKLIAEGHDVNATDSLERQPLYWAAREGNHQIMELLISVGAKCDRHEYLGLKPLHVAASHGHTEVVKLLLKHGVSPTTPKSYRAHGIHHIPSEAGKSPLEYASTLGHLGVIEKMVPYLQAQELELSLSFAVEAGQSKVVRNLLHTVKVSPNAIVASPPNGMRNYQLGRGPFAIIYLAARSRDSKNVENLLQAGATMKPWAVSKASDCEPSVTRQLRSPLHGVLDYNHDCIETSAREVWRIIRHLLEAGCDINSRDTRGRTPLMTLCATSIHACSDIDSKLFLEAGANPKLTDDLGNTALHLACRNRAEGRTLNDIRNLLDYGADVNVPRENDGCQPIHCVAENLFHRSQGTASRLELLIKSGADINAQNYVGDTILHVAAHDAAHNGTVAPGIAWSEIIKSRPNANIANFTGQTPLHVLADAVFNHREFKDIVQILIESGVNFEAEDYAGRTPLHVAAQNGSTETVEILLELGANPNAIDADGKSPLCYFITHHNNTLHNWTVRDFVRKGVDLFQRDRDSNTVLHTFATSFAGTGEQVNLLESLLSGDISLDVTNREGCTPLHLLARRQECNEAVGVQGSLNSFIGTCHRFSKQFDINTQDVEGYTALHYAAASSEKHVNAILEAGADPNIKATNGRTALHIAAIARKSSILSLLLRASQVMKLPLDVDVEDRNGRTPLFDACSSGISASVYVLLTAGAEVNHKARNSLVMRKDISEAEAKRSTKTPLEACAEFPAEQRLWDFLDIQKDQSRNRAVIDHFRPQDGLSQRPCIGESVKLLLAKGAKTEDNRAYEIALSQGCFEMATILKKEAPVDNSHKRTAIAETKESSLLIHGPSMSNAARSKEGVECTGTSHQCLTDGTSGQTESAGTNSIFYKRDAGNPLIAQCVEDGMSNEIRKLKKQAKTHDQNPQQTPLLHVACSSRYHNIEMLYALIDEIGLDVNINSVPSAEHKKEKRSPGRTALHILARGAWYWNVEAIEVLIQSGANIHALDTNGDNPLHIACSKSHADPHGGYWKNHCVKKLLENGADVNDSNNRGESCLKLAIWNATILETLLKNGADITLDKKPILFQAAESTNEESLRVLLEAGADPNLPYDQCDDSHVRRQYLLQLFIRRKIPLTDFDTYLKMTSMLLDYGADLYVKLDNDTTLLHEIFQTSDWRLIIFFLERENLNLNLNVRRTDGMTVLHAMCTSVVAHTRGFPHVLKDSRFEKYHYDGPIYLDLVRSKRYAPTIEWCAIDTSGCSVLHHIIGNNHYQNRRSDGVEALNELFESTDIAKVINHKNKAGFSPLHHALAQLKVGLVEVLLRKGATCSEPDPFGKNMLHFLARVDSPCEFLSPRFKALIQQFIAVAHPKSINSPNSDGDTPLLVLLADCGNTEHIFDRRDHDRNKVANVHNLTYLINDLGADVRIRNDKTGQTALHAIARRVYQKEEPNSYSGVEGDNAVVFKHVVDVYGLDPLVEDNSGRTALDVAAAAGNEGILGLYERKKMK